MAVLRRRQLAGADAGIRAGPLRRSDGAADDRTPPAGVGGDGEPATAAGGRVGHADGRRAPAVCRAKCDRYATGVAQSGAAVRTAGAGDAAGHSMRERWAVVELCAVGGARQPAGTGAAWAGRGPGRAGGGTECAHAGTADGLAGDLQGRCVLCADRSGLPGGLPRADPGRGAGVDPAGARRAGAGRTRAVPQSALARASHDAAGAEGTSGRPSVRDGDLRLDRPAQGRDGAVCAAAQLAACRLAAFSVRGRGAGAAEDLDRLCGVGKGVAKRAAGGGGTGDAAGRAGEGQPGVGAGD